MTKKRAPRKAKKPAPPSPSKLPEPTKRDVRPAELAILATLINLGDRMGSEEMCLAEAYRRIYDADEFLDRIITGPESLQKAIEWDIAHAPPPAKVSPEGLVSFDEIIRKIREQTSFSPRKGKPQQIAHIKRFLDSRNPAAKEASIAAADIATGVPVRIFRMIANGFASWWEKDCAKRNTKRVKVAAKKAAAKRKKEEGADMQKYGHEFHAQGPLPPE